jgi:hypothetical protein
LEEKEERIICQCLPFQATTSEPKRKEVVSEELPSTPTDSKWIKY